MIISAIPGIIGGEASTGLFILSLVITGTGTGGFKANISPLVAEQYRRRKPFIDTTKSGERVIVDPVLTTSRIYMVRVPPLYLMPYSNPANPVFLPLHKYWGAHRANWYGLCGKGESFPRFWRPSDHRVAS